MDYEKDDTEFIVKPQNENCKSDKMTIFVGVIYAYKGLLLVSLNMNMSPALTVVSSQFKEMIKLMKILWFWKLYQKSFYKLVPKSSQTCRMYIKHYYYRPERSYFIPLTSALLSQTVKCLPFFLLVFSVRKIPSYFSVFITLSYHIICFYEFQF